ncbi:signal recognition particle-docking protein FtsY [Pararhizobium mangrovi]|uniref:Signal recognition particle receptor FtsY n=1 Tax=Pararhizobium mangrovi TaxID=2590452 RepID=A0A506U3B2_9HYPH|nr:signal recognition particle-docking protein FtsY [Pararhizobium mangrovi]TPW27029.1 signal recognition particle-docking protein FtsY [Pararhizobium mangrovi]
MAKPFFKKFFSFGRKDAEPVDPPEVEEASEVRGQTAATAPDEPTPGRPKPQPDVPDEPSREPKPEQPAPRPDVPEEPAPEPDTPERPATPDIPDHPEPQPEIPEETPGSPGISPPIDPGVPPSPPSQPEPRLEMAAAANAPAATTYAMPAGLRIGAPAEQAEPEASEAARSSWFRRMREGLSRTSSQLTGQISGIFTKRKLDEDTLQDLEDVLIQADLGVETAMRVTDSLASGRYGRDIAPAEVSSIMAGEIEKVLTPVAKPLELDLSVKPHVILVVGVNGTGKTTTIGKLAAKLTRGGLTVTLAAGDTFRAAAIEQLRIWGERTGSPVVSSKLGADAAGLAFDAYEQAKRNGSDVVIIDTAGRLQNKAELMSELEKIVRVLGKHDPDAPHTVLQTLDATTGQNAMNQVEIFRNVAGVNGLVMTKLDGTARGGILVAISAKHKLPVYFIGVGEGIDDLEPFEAKEFAGAIAGVPEAA